MRHIRITMMLLTCCGIACSAATTDAADPLLQWTFDEATSGDQDALDTGVAPAENGQFMGGATRTASTPGGASAAAADLLSVGDGYVQATDATNLEGLQALTITAWINLQADPPSDGSGNDRIAALQGDGETGFAGFSFNTNAPDDAVGDNIYTADEFRLGMFIGGEFAFESGQTDVDIAGLGGEWIFVATTFDSNEFFDNLTMFFGTETAGVSQLGISFSIEPGPIATAGANFYVGKTDAATAANTSIEGFIDDVRIYDSALSLAELDVIRLENLSSSFLEADFNEDGSVNGDDFLLWQGGFGTPDGATKMDGDSDGDGDVDGDDFLKWQQQFGSADGSASAAVPEPSALMMLGLCSLLFGVHRRRGRG